MASTPLSETPEDAIQSDAHDESDSARSDGQDSPQLNEERAARVTQAFITVWPTLAQLEVVKKSEFQSLQQLHDAIEVIDTSYEQQKKTVSQILDQPYRSLDSLAVAAQLDSQVQSLRDAVMNHHELLIATTEGMNTMSVARSSLYSALDVTKQEIRLLRLLPGSKSAKLDCEMFTVSMNEIPEYFALSYTWGDDTLTNSMSVNNLEISITQNLEVALRNIRGEENAMTIWIDALCINQKDLAEKGRQITYMWHIYEQAESTIIWLGESSDDSDLAMEYIRGVNEDSLSDLVKQLDRKIWKAIDELLHRPWWSRVWIIQEAVASKNAVVRCGTKEARFDSFVTMSRIVNRRVAPKKATDSEEDFASMALPTCALLSMVYDFEDAPEEGRALEPWIIRAQEFKSSNPRDKIYALLGFASPEEKELIRPDYAKSYNEIQLEVVARFLTESKRLITLQRGRDPSSVDLPSWVRLGYPGQSYVPMIFPATGRTPYSASGNSIIRPSFSNDLRIVTLCGSIFDTITFVSPRVVPVGDNFVGPFICSIWERCAQTLVSPSRNPYTNSCGIEEAFWRTLILDRLFDWSGPPPSEFGRFFEVWMGRAQVPDEYISSREEASPEEIRSSYLQVFQKTILMHLLGRSFFITKKGYMGLFATVDGAEEGDSVCLLGGGEVPFILRSKYDSSYYLIGEAYVHGIMDGSAWNGGQPLEVGVKQSKEDGWEEFHIN